MMAAVDAGPVAVYWTSTWAWQLYGGGVYDRCGSVEVHDKGICMRKEVYANGMYERMARGSHCRMRPLPYL